MAFDVEQMWEQHWPGIYSRLSLRCVENHPVDSVYDQIAWARFVGGKVCMRVEIEGLDVICHLGPASGEPEWYLSTVVRWLGGLYEPTPRWGDHEQFRRLGGVLEFFWPQIQERFAPERAETTRAELNAVLQLQYAENRRKYMGE